MSSHTISNPNIDVHILGLGAMGCLWAYALNQTPVNTHIILRNTSNVQTDHIGMSFSSRISNQESNRFKSTATKAFMLSKPCKYLIVTTKANDTLEALLSIKNFITESTFIVMFQNGMGIHSEIAENFPNNNIACAVTTEGAFCSKPFHVTHAGKGKTTIGMYQRNEQYKEHLFDDLLITLRNPLLAIEKHQKISSALWEKLTINAAINAYTVIYHCKNGQLLEIPEAMKRIEAYCSELSRIEDKTGYKRGSESIFDNVKRVLKNTAQNYSSMHQDIQKNRITEIKYINGYIKELATQYFLDCPENEKILSEIKTIQRHKA